MNERDKLLSELESEFEKVKKEYGINSSFDEIDEAFKIKNTILGKGYVPLELHKIICTLIASDYRDWHTYFNNLLIPNQGYYASQVESRLFSSEKDKERLWSLVKKSMEISSLSAVVNLKGDDREVAKFIDSTTQYWTNEFKPILVEIMTRINEAWSRE